MAKPGNIEPVWDAKKPTIDTKVPTPKVIEAPCGEMAMPVWNMHGGPQNEPIVKR